MTPPDNTTYQIIYNGKQLATGSHAHCMDQLRKIAQKTAFGDFTDPVGLMLRGGGYAIEPVGGA